MRTGDVSPPALAVASKVPEVTAYFWITKVLTTGMGEAASDYLGNRLGTAIAMPLAALALVVALIVQFRARRYLAWVYWTAVVMVSVFGTMIADGLHSAGVSYSMSTPVFGAILAGIFISWYRRERSLSVHHIHTRRREGFYWATVVATFALGTALGDMAASTLKLGYVESWFLFAVMIGIPAVGHRQLGWNAIVSFWSAYVITRPLGASVADWLAVPQRQGGLGWGTGAVTGVMTLAILGFVAYLALSRRDTEPADKLWSPAADRS
jgi:uncharacterized membrane-anchored protein